MKLALTLLLSLSIVGCSDDEPAAATPGDTGTFADGPITERPDDGVDTNVADTQVADTGSTADSTAADSTATDTLPEAAADVGAGVTVVTVGAGRSSFSPAVVNIKVGEKVRWVWTGGGHNVVSGAACTADSKFCSPSDTSCATAATSSAGTMYEHTFATAGAFPYFCAPHCLGGMVGTVNVTP